MMRNTSAVNIAIAVAAVSVRLSIFAQTSPGEQPKAPVPTPATVSSTQTLPIQPAPPQPSSKPLDAAQVTQTNVNQRTPAATDPAEIQSLQNRLEALKKANDDAAKTNQQKIDELNARLFELAKQNKTNASAGDQIKALNETVAKISAKIAAIEQSASDTANSTIEVDKIRYLAGEEVQKVIVHNAATLQVSTALGSSLSDFQSAMNPDTDEDFRKELDLLQNNVSRGTQSLLQKVRSSGWFSNPVISLAVSFGTFLVENSASKKIDQFSNVICLNQFASQNVADVKLIDEQIKNLDARVADFERNSEMRFGVYVSSIKYPGGYSDVVTAINNTSQDPIPPRAETFFAALPKRKSPSEPLPADYVTVRFQIDKVKEYIAEYESLLKDVSAFFTSFQQVAQKDSSFTGDCATKPSVVRVSQKLTGLAKVIGEAKRKFETAYVGSVSADSKRILYGGQ